MRVKVHPSFAVYLACIALISSYTACLSVLLTLFVHEICHYAACRLLGGQIECLEITPLGGVMTYKRGSVPPKGVKGITINAAGPIGNYLFLLCVSLQNVQWCIPAALLHNLIVMNTSMLVLNLLPALPLDGGHIVFCLGYYFFPLVKLIRFLSAMGKAIGGLGLILSVYGLLVWQTLNCSLVIVSLYLIFCSVRSQHSLLAENIYTIIHERLSAPVQIKRMTPYLVSPDIVLYELIPCLKDGHAVSFFFMENRQYLELPEAAFCQALLASPTVTVREAQQSFT